MMEHTEIRRKLSAYLENAVNAREKEEIGRHLSECSSCRMTLANLELTLGRPHTPPGAEPPSWLIEKIARKQRAAAAGAEPSPWRRRLSALRQMKFPFGAFALALLCVVAYYLTAIDSRQTAPRVRSAASPRPSAVAPKPSDLQAPAPAAELPLPPSLFETPSVATPHKGSVPPLPSVPPPPALPGRALTEPGLQPAGEDVPQERTTEPADLGWGHVAGEPVPEKAEVVLGVTDAAAATAAIEQVVGRLGGTVVGQASGGGSHFLATQIEALKVPELTGRLARIGTVRERPQLSAGAEGKVDLIIRW